MSYDQTLADEIEKHAETKRQLAEAQARIGMLKEALEDVCAELQALINKYERPHDPKEDYDPAENTTLGRARAALAAQPPAHRRWHASGEGGEGRGRCQVIQV
jgi:chromosome segregation ATPase